MTANTDLMGEAKKSLEGNWLIAVVSFLVYGLLTGVLQSIPFIGMIAGFVIGGPMSLGLIIFSKNIVEGKEVKLEQIFDGFKHFVPALLTYLVMLILVILGFMLLIIPGIILSFGFALSLYIVSDEPDLGVEATLRKSYEMMKGYKMKLFGLSLLFFLLGIACIFTLGIGFFFLGPFAQVTMVKFYQDVKADYDGVQPAAEPVAPAPEPAPAVPTATPEA